MWRNSPEEMKENLKTHGDLARLSRQLATIHTNVPVNYRLKDFSLSPPDLNHLKEIFKNWSSTNSSKKLSEKKGSESTTRTIV